MSRAVAMVLATAMLASVVGAQKAVVPPAPAAPAAVPALRQGNPPALAATELLDRAAPGVAPRVRFEWAPVSGATAYVLTGRWTDGHSWEVHSQEYRVTARNATDWRPTRVVFDISLPRGSHSWQLVAVAGPNDAGDFEHPVRLSFDLR
jgi:hypothetical protein